MNMVSPYGLKLIKQFEGCRLVPYKCSAGVPTIGYGATYKPDGCPVSMCDEPITQGQAEAMFERDIETFAAKVDELIKVPVTMQQFDAVVSFAYNVGTGALSRSTLLRKLNLLNYQGAADEFPKWRKAGGKVVQGLVNRRKLEREHFLS